VQLWSVPTVGSAVLYAIKVSPDGSLVYVAGSSSVSDPAYVARSYAAAYGGEVWSTSYQGPLAGGSDVARAIALTPTGQLVFVTGQSDGVNSGSDYATVAYRP